MPGPYAEADLFPLSALQHLAFCERQCALIHLEGAWAENVFTTEGRLLHEKVDNQGDFETREGERIARGLPLRSLRLGLVGKADVVEFHPVAQGGAVLDGLSGKWRPFPVEYKRGKPKRDRRDEVQLCAQALCLEEMLKTGVPAGALFYGRLRRRTQVEFDASLRKETEFLTEGLRELIAAGVTPRAVREPKCDSCSLLEICLPEANSQKLSARRYLDAAIFNAS
ncbi:MAG: CRISPR-associated protein Cas4 [Elusimicrobiota bacterium]